MNLTPKEILKIKTKGTLNIIENSPLHKAVISAMKYYAKQEVKLFAIPIVKGSLLKGENWIENMTLAENVAYILDKYDIICPLEDYRAKKEIENLIKNYP